MSTRSVFNRRLGVVMILLVLFFAQLLGSVGVQQPPTPAPAAPVIRMDVDLVLLHATVTNSQGDTVTGLSEAAFHLFVDDKPHPISFFQGEDAPVAVGLVVDNSSSMAPVRANVIAAALAFARSSNSLDEIFVVNVSSTPRLALPSAKPFTSDVSTLDAALSSFSAEGSTALYDGIGLGLAHLEKASIQPRVLLVVSDGGDNSSHITLSALLNWAENAHVAIYCIGLFNDADRDKNPAILKQLSDSTGGKVYFPSSVSDISNVTVEIAKQIRSQYTLGFTDMHDVKYHNIRVVAEDRARGPLTVHTRTGYTSVKP